MPELPEVETVVRTLKPHIVDNIFQNVLLLHNSSLHPLSLPLEKLLGLRICAVRRRGKLILLDLAPFETLQKPNQELPSVLVAHLRMTGALLVYASNVEIDSHTRCCFDLLQPNGQKQCLLFKDIRAFGQIFVATPQLLEEWNFWRELAPDPFEISEQNFLDRLATKKSALKAVLLDQRIISGIGNIYVDESLFQEHIDPRTKANELAPAKVSSLLYTMRKILTQAIEQCGTSFRNYRDADGKSGAFQNQLAVYGKAGQPCPLCQRPLQKIRVAGRGTVFCPNCQK